MRGSSQLSPPPPRSVSFVLTVYSAAALLGGADGRGRDNAVASASATTAQIRRRRTDSLNDIIHAAVEPVHERSFNGGYVQVAGSESDEDEPYVYYATTEDVDYRTNTPTSTPLAAQRTSSLSTTSATASCESYANDCTACLTADCKWTNGSTCSSSCLDDATCWFHSTSPDGSEYLSSIPTEYQRSPSQICHYANTQSVEESKSTCLALTSQGCEVCQKEGGCKWYGNLCDTSCDLYSRCGTHEAEDSCPVDEDVGVDDVVIGGASSEEGTATGSTKVVTEAYDPEEEEEEEEEELCLTNECFRASPKGVEAMTDCSMGGGGLDEGCMASKLKRWVRKKKRMEMKKADRDDNDKPNKIKGKKGAFKGGKKREKWTPKRCKEAEPVDVDLKINLEDALISTNDNDIQQQPMTLGIKFNVPQIACAKWKDGGDVPVELEVLRSSNDNDRNDIKDKIPNTDALSTERGKDVITGQGGDIGSDGSDAREHDSPGEKTTKDEEDDGDVVDRDSDEHNDSHAGEGVSEEVKLDGAHVDDEELLDDKSTNIHHDPPARSSDPPPEVRCREATDDYDAHTLELAKADEMLAVTLAKYKKELGELEGEDEEEFAVAYKFAIEKLERDVGDIMKRLRHDRDEARKDMDKWCDGGNVDALQGLNLVSAGSSGSGIEDTPNDVSGGYFIGEGVVQGGRSSSTTQTKEQVGEGSVYYDGAYDDGDARVTGGTDDISFRGQGKNPGHTQELCRQARATYEDCIKELEDGAAYLEAQSNVVMNNGGSCDKAGGQFNEEECELQIQTLQDDVERVMRGVVSKRETAEKAIKKWCH